MFLKNKQQCEYNQNIHLFQKIFDRKYSARTSQEFITLRNRVLSNPNQPKTLKHIRTGPSLLPRVGELEKISLGSNMKTHPKMQMTNLQMYITKKTINKQQNPKLYLTMQNSQFNNKTDTDILDHFNNLLNLKKYSLEANTQSHKNSIFGSENTAIAQKKQQILKKKSELTQIVKEMIKMNKIAPLEDEEQDSVDSNNKQLKKEDNKNKNINWIIRECIKYEGKYTHRHRKIKTQPKIKKNKKK